MSAASTLTLTLTLNPKGSTQWEVEEAAAALANIGVSIKNQRLLVEAQFATFTPLSFAPACSLGS